MSVDPKVIGVILGEPDPKKQELEKLKYEIVLHLGYLAKGVEDKSIAELEVIKYALRNGLSPKHDIYHIECLVDMMREHNYDVQAIKALVDILVGRNQNPILRMFSSLGQAINTSTRRF